MGDGQTNQTSCQNGTQILQFLFVSPMWWILLSVPWYRIHGCVLDHCLDVIAQKGVLTRPPKTPKLENQDLPIFYRGTLGTRVPSFLWRYPGYQRFFLLLMHRRTIRLSQSHSLVFPVWSQWDGKIQCERLLAACQIYSSRESHLTAHKPTAL